MALRQARKILLWFHAGELSQAQAVAICDAHQTMDVRFRKVVRDVDRDILESFDEVGGDVPQRYISHARENNLTIHTTLTEVKNENNTENGGTAASLVDAGQSGTGSVPPSKGTKATTVAPPLTPPSPTEPAPAVNTTVPPPAN